MKTQETVEAAILLCAGQSTRTWGVMAQVGEKHHKGELVIHGVAVIAERIAQWVEAGVTQIVLVGSTQQALANLLDLCDAKQIRSRAKMCADRNDPVYAKKLNRLADSIEKAKIKTTIQPEAGGTAHAVQCAMEGAPDLDLAAKACAVDFMDDDWIRTAAESAQPDARAQAVQTYQKHPASMVISAMNVEPEEATRYGIARVDNRGVISETQEKLGLEELKRGGWINPQGKCSVLMGIQILPPAVMAMVPKTEAIVKGGKAEKFLNTTMGDAMKKDIQAVAFVPVGVYTDAGTNEGFERAIVIRTILEKPEMLKSIVSHPALAQIVKQCVS